MAGGRAGDGTSRQPHDGEEGSRSNEPPGSTESTRLLTDLVAERLEADAERALRIDVDGDVVTSPGGRWSATLAPLRACVADIPTDGWPLVVDREIERWRRAVGSVERVRGAERAGHTRSIDAPIVLRLSSSSGAPGRTLRPAFGETAWELVRDLGRDGLAAPTAGPDGRGDGVAAGPEDGVPERVWELAAAGTVARHQDRWSHLVLDDGAGLIVGGPHLSALLFDPRRLVGHIEDNGVRGRLQATVFTNSLLLVTVVDRVRKPALDVVVESLRRFTSGRRRHFEPFTVDLPEKPCVPGTGDGDVNTAEHPGKDRPC